MAAEAGDAFERAANTEYRHQVWRQHRQGSLSAAREAFHGRLQTLLWLSVALGVHWYIVQRVTNWMVGHGVLIVITFLGLIGAWGDQRVAEARLLERQVSADD